MDDMAFAPDGNTFAFASEEDGSIQLWDANNGKKLIHFNKDQTVADRQSLLAFSPDGTRLVSSGREKVKLWALPSGEPLQDFEPKGRAGRRPWREFAQPVAISSDGAWIATVAEDPRYDYNLKPTIYIWDALTGRQLRAIQRRDQSGLSDIEFSPDGKQLLVIGARCGLYDCERQLLVWSLPH
ncbi:MAG: WD40 repeat domain-containing protein [Cyanobacteria bacterium J06576_12]